VNVSQFKMSVYASGGVLPTRKENLPSVTSVDGVPALLLIELASITLSAFNGQGLGAWNTQVSQICNFHLHA
jgi:hypothetical protein